MPARAAGQVDPNVIGQHTTNVHLDESMVEKFKPQVMIAPMLFRSQEFPGDETKHLLSRRRAEWGTFTRSSPWPSC
jgi:hypothetical protein